MDDSRKKHLDTLDGTLAEVREQLQYTHEQGEVFELARSSFCCKLSRRCTASTTFTR